MGINESPAALLAKIKTMGLVEMPAYAPLKTRLYARLFSKIPVIMNKIPKGYPLFRTVPLFRKDIDSGQKTNLSYRPEQYKYPYFNRCSEPEQRHFYCATDRHLSMGECSYFISNVNGPDAVFDKDSEQLELGLWIANRDIYLADLRFGNFAHAGNKEQQAVLKAKYDEFAKEEYVRDFFRYINECFETPVRRTAHLQYWLTACYSNYLFDDYFKPQAQWGTMTELNFDGEMKIDGILYHSVQGIKTTPPMEGFNVALRTELIDDNSLTLTKAGIFETKQTGEKEFIFDKLLKINGEIRSDKWVYRTPSSTEAS